MKKAGFGVKLKQLFTKKESENFYEHFEDILIESDIGAVSAIEISNKLREKYGKKGPANKNEVIEELRKILDSMILQKTPSIDTNRLSILLVLGVNGVGKTTTIAKMAEYYRKNYNIEAVLSAGDTFRAAAIDQLILHGEKLGLKVVHQQPGSDPGAVIFDSIESAKAKKFKMVIADTAGRMHNKENLVKELQKIDKIISSKAPEADYRKILVIDSTTGLNGFKQAEIFNEAVGIDQIVLAKYDSSAKGGIAIPISSKLNLPFSFIGTGEKYSNLEVFNKEDFIRNITG